MQHLLAKIHGKTQSLRQWRIAGYDRALLQLELLYRKVDIAGVATLKDSLDATRKILATYIFLPDFYFIVVGITLMVFAAELFVKPGVDYGLARPLIFFVSGILAGVVPMCMAFLTLPPHLLFKGNIWGLTLLNVVVSAVVFAYIQPMIASTMINDGVLSFSGLVWPMLVFYFFAEFYILMRLGPNVCFNTYQARHAKDTIEKFIPANKLGPLISLSAQDHYVEMVTANGTHLERMTIKKAIELAPDGSGLQVHRSHWVAFSAILDLEKTGERYAVLLRNGAKLPVGKSKVQDVQRYLDSR